MANQQPSPPVSSASSTDFGTFHGPNVFTLAQFVAEIENIAGSTVEIVKFNLNNWGTTDIGCPIDIF